MAKKKKAKKSKPAVKPVVALAPAFVFPKPEAPVLIIYPPPPQPLTTWEQIVKYLKSLY